MGLLCLCPHKKRGQNEFKSLMWEQICRARIVLLHISVQLLPKLEDGT